ncbi:MAG: Nramp family divalent metal transporter [Firmicutes bacterium]|nr:Nramp family divalent metal transporter [Bacillota bacterium]
MKKVKWSLIGPGIVLAAAGVGAGDVVSSAVSGASYGYSLLWALLIGALFKYFLNEGMARYQLATGRTFMEGYSSRSRWFNYYFIVYLVIWSFIVGGALLSSVGLVTSAMFPIFPLEVWGIIAAIFGLVIIRTGTYKIFEKIMKILAIMMFFAFVISAIVVKPPLLAVLKGLLVPALPQGRGWFDVIFKVLALMGGVGGTVTIMAYSYWLRECNIEDKKELPTVRVDLLIGYIVTFVFSLSVVVVSAVLIHPIGGEIAGKEGIIDLARTLESIMGPFGYWAFVLGFWAAVFSSVLSFYQAIPYLFNDAVRIVKQDENVEVGMQSKYYQGYVLYIFLAPLLLLFFREPIGLTLLYSVLGAFFMPFLALMLLLVGNSREMGDCKNTPAYNLVMALIFIVMSIVSFYPLFR